MQAQTKSSNEKESLSEDAEDYNIAESTLYLSVT